MPKKASHSEFGERLQEAAEKAGIPYKQTAIGDYLGVRKQNVDAWMLGSLPRADQLFEMADKFGVDPRWLATGKTSQKLRSPEATSSEKLLEAIRKVLDIPHQGIDELIEAIELLMEENGTARRKGSPPRRSQR